MSCKDRRAPSSSVPSSCASCSQHPPRHPSPGSAGVMPKGSERARWWALTGHACSEARASAVDKTAPGKEEPKPQGGPTDNSSPRQLCKPSGSFCRLPPSPGPSLMPAGVLRNKLGPQRTTRLSVLHSILLGLTHGFFSPPPLPQRAAGGLRAICSRVRHLSFEIT